jgi:apolipoprotein N-acyltransferase
LIVAVKSKTARKSRFSFFFFFINFFVLFFFWIFISLAWYAREDAIAARFGATKATAPVKCVATEHISTAIPRLRAKTSCVIYNID